MKYLRSYPYRVQVWMFLLLGYLLFCVAQFFVIPVLFTKITGFSFSDLTNINPGSSASLINAGTVMEGVVNLTTFFLTAFLFAYLSHPKPAEYLGLRTPVMWIQVVLAVTTILGAMPLLMGLDNLMSHINMGESVKKMEADKENMMNAFLNITSLSGLWRALLFLSIIPAIGEEMFFRGTLLKLIRKWAGSMSAPIIFSALIFAAFHMEIYGMLSIFLAGVLLAVIYYLTGSLWCSIAAHIFFNGTQIVLQYAYNSNAAMKASLDKNSAPVALMVGGAIVFSVSFYLLLKNKTPLPKNWTDDFAPKEPRDDDDGEFMAQT